MGKQRLPLKNKSRTGAMKTNHTRYHPHLALEAGVPTR